MRKYEESKTTRIMIATVPHVTSGLGLRKFQADGFLLTRVYIKVYVLFIYVCLVLVLNLPYNIDGDNSRFERYREIVWNIRQFL